MSKKVELEGLVDYLEKAKDQLVQSEKMASIGQLAAGVAHEINNPIGFSLSNISTLQEYVEALASVDSYVLNNMCHQDKVKLAYHQHREALDIDFIKEDIENLLSDTLNGLQRVSDIVANLKKVSHSGEDDKQLSDMNEVIEDSLKVVWNEIKYVLSVEKNFADLPEILCYPNEIHQVLMNMFINASHACEESGVLKVSTALTSLGDKNAVCIGIEDNGKGMDKATVKKIFDPFFTTKPVGVGTGLGLSVSFGIIEKHGGKIVVDSEVGKGTRFNLILPITEPV